MRAQIIHVHDTHYARDLNNKLHTINNDDNCTINNNYN
jgi:hypothetical protein